MKGDACILFIHFFVGITLLALIELEAWTLFIWCPSISVRHSHSMQRRGPVLIKDDDVIEEERRVALQDT